MSFLARGSITSLVLLTLLSGAWGQSFGRFGYQAPAYSPGFKFEAAGFRANQSRADQFSFPSGGSPARAISVSEYSATYWLAGKAGGPSKLRINQFAPGFELYFPQGMQLGLSSTQAPFLSWGEGSVGPGVPTPAGRWVLISFQDDQPAVLLCVPGGDISLKLSGRPTDWRLASENQTGQWVRVCLPFGERPTPTVDVAALGAAVQKVKLNESFWTQPAPNLIKREARTSDLGTVGVWTFDSPLAVVPLAVLLSGKGGYGIKILSKLTPVDATFAETPLAYVQDGRLAIEFPMAPVKAGRSAVIGVPADRKMPLGSAFQLEYVFSLALETLIVTPDMTVDTLANGALNDYLVNAPNEPEPLTKQHLPFRSTGEGMDLAAAQALLAQCMILSKGTFEPNPLFTSILWTRDAMTWMPAIGDPEIRRRTAALGAITGFFSDDPDTRLEGAMFEAGLAAERGRAIWQGNPNVFREPIERLRRTAFSVQEVWSVDPFLKSLQSGLRIGGEVRAAITESPDGAILNWQPVTGSASELWLQSPTPFELTAKANLKSLAPLAHLDWQRFGFTSRAQDQCQAKLTMNGWRAQVGTFVAPPKYTESSR